MFRFALTRPDLSEHPLPAGEGREPRWKLALKHPGLATLRRGVSPIHACQAQARAATRAAPTLVTRHLSLSFVFNNLLGSFLEFLLLLCGRGGAAAADAPTDGGRLARLPVWVKVQPGGAESGFSQIRASGNSRGTARRAPTTLRRENTPAASVLEILWPLPTFSLRERMSRRVGTGEGRAVAGAGPGFVGSANSRRKFSGMLNSDGSFRLALTASLREIADREGQRSAPAAGGRISRQSPLIAEEPTSSSACRCACSGRRRLRRIPSRFRTMWDEDEW